MNILSLFDGMSCGQIALNKVGIEYENYFASEVDKHAINVTQRNFPNTVQLGAVEGVTAANLPKIDLLIGGSPYQGFSFAGKQLQFDDPRSALFFQYLRLLRDCRPDYFLLENVKMKTESQKAITNFLGVEPIEIDSALVSAQHRKRLYWTNIPGVTQPEDKKIRLKDIIENGDCLRDKSQTILSTIYKENAKSMVTRNKLGLLVKYHLSDKAVTRIERSRFGKEFYTVDSDKAGTLVAGYYKIPSDGIYLKEGDIVRKFTPLECERLQTVPDNYTATVSDTQRYKMLGNGWTVDVIAHIFNELKVEL